jgi:RNA polymerase sigma factor (sigma-70 family)
MMNMILMNPATVSDEQLWRLACEGDREAFGRIVERYQSLVCSLAYSACGALGTSEDMAQETFITAWHRLKDLRDPGKLRQWLCGIVRNIAANAVRRELRRGGEPESLDAAAGHLSVESDPAAQTITREEETLLWRTLAEMPASYREPLVLFYREEKSVAEVALKLDLSSDTVKQRLSRGRAMLREEMAALVESTLTRTDGRVHGRCWWHCHWRRLRPPVRRSRREPPPVSGQAPPEKAFWPSSVWAHSLGRSLVLFAPTSERKPRPRPRARTRSAIVFSVTRVTGSLSSAWS